MNKKTGFFLTLLAFLLALPSSALAGVFDAPEVIEDTVQEEVAVNSRPLVLENFITVDMSQFKEKTDVDAFLKTAKEFEIETLLVALRDPVSGCVYYTSHEYTSKSCSGYETSNNIGRYFFMNADKKDFEVIVVLPAFYDKYYTERKPKYQMQALDLETGLKDYVTGWISPYVPQGYRQILGNAKNAALAYQKYIDGFVFSHLYFPETGADLSYAAIAKLKKTYPLSDWENLAPGTADWDTFLSWRSDQLAEFSGLLRRVVRRLLPEAHEFGAVFPSESAVSPRGYVIHPDNGIDFQKLSQVADFRIYFNLDWQNMSELDPLPTIKNIINLMGVWNPVVTPMPVLSTRRSNYETILLDDEYETMLSEIKAYMLDQYLGYAVFYADEPWTELSLEELNNLASEPELQLASSASIF
ncbi:MAG: hypothetical protein PHU71_00305 [Candidatus Gracilibacteria bacterium]|nr:hypothetical protein [Candidatus Gracilibacteria bacterium]